MNILSIFNPRTVVWFACLALWLMDTGWAAGLLKLGDQVRTKDGLSRPVTGKTAKAASTTVYNLEIADNHTYFVSANAVLVHNTCTAGAVTKTATHWGNPKTLTKHFAEHGADFGAKNADDYAKMASDFFRRSQVERLPTKITPDGTIRVYDPKNNIFGSYNPSGTTKTFYKPNPAKHGLPSNIDYWNKQSGTTPWEP